MITKTEVHKATIGKRRGWAFSIWFNDKPYPNLISALFKTKDQAEKELYLYMETGEFKFYGSAEVL